MVVDLSQFKIELWLSFRENDFFYDLVCTTCGAEDKIPFGPDPTVSSVTLEELVHKAVTHIHKIKAPV